MTRRAAFWLVQMLVVVAGVQSCGGGGEAGGVASPATSSFTPVLSWVKLTVSPLIVEMGKTATATGEGFNQNGGPFTAGTFGFVSSAPAVANVDDAGTVTALASGVATITASLGGKTSAREVTVIPVAVARIEVAPDVITLDPGASAALVATLYDANTSTLAGRAVAWSSSDTIVAVVNSSGQVSARRPGRAKITAGAGGKFAAVVVSVTGAAEPAGDMLVTFAVPVPGALVGDTLEVYADVSTSHTIARVEAIFDGVTLPLVKRSVGALGGAWLWYGLFDISGVHFGQYFVLVTATDTRNFTATDSVLFERDPVKKGGGAAGPGKTNKLVAPTVAPTVTRRRPRGHLQGIP